MLKLKGYPATRAHLMLCKAALVCVTFWLALAQGAPGLSYSPPQDKQTRPQQQEQEDAVRLHADLVVVNATVTDQAGRYAHGLSAKDFSILEDNAPQKVDSFLAEEAPFAAAILIDMSGSMAYKFGLARAAAAVFIERIRESDQVAVYGFNRKVQLFQDFSSSRDITEYIWDARAEDVTRMYDCMSEALDALSRREETRRAILLISDGWDSASVKASLDSVMKKASDTGTTIYTIDLTDNDALMGSGSEAIPLRRGRRDMQEFANQTGGRYLHMPQGEKLEEAFTNVVEELRNQYTLTYYSTNEKRDGRWRKLSVGVARPGLIIRARRGYYAPKGATREGLNKR